MAKKLSDMKVGESATIKGYADADAQYRKRLLSMGLTRGTAFEVTRVAPLGDPFEIVIKGYKLSLRKSEASAVLVGN